MLHHRRTTNSMEDVDITEDRTIFVDEEDMVLNVKGIGEVALAVGVTVI